MPNGRARCRIRPAAAEPTAGIRVRRKPPALGGTWVQNNEDRGAHFHLFRFRSRADVSTRARACADVWSSSAFAAVEPDPPRPVGGCLFLLVPTRATSAPSRVARRHRTVALRRRRGAETSVCTVGFGFGTRFLVATCHAAHSALRHFHEGRL